MNKTTFRPAFLSSLKNYDRSLFLKDAVAGLTVGVIALPLAIGFGIASGVTPAQGLWTAIIAGFLISAIGGSRFQIGGPTGAFVPVLAAVVAAHGYAGLALATMMAGVILLIMGGLKLGGLLKFIPYPVIAGFTTGIAVIIFTAQLNEGLGLGIKMPEHVPQQWLALATHLQSVEWHTVATLLLSFGILYGLPRISRLVPAAIVTVVAITAFVTAMGWPVATIGSKFGGIPPGLPHFGFPDITLGFVRTLMGPAFTIAILGAIESLLSASVADGMTDTRHDPNQELLGQGIANLVTPMFGGIAATGAIARTAANIRSGAQTSVSGLVHSVVLLLFVLVAAPLARFIPLATLSAILMAVALRMAEWDNFGNLWKGSRTDFLVLVAAFGLTVVFDLTIGVGAGLMMAVVMFVRRMEGIAHVHLLTADSDPELSGSDSLRGKQVPKGVVLYRFHGPFFFAVADKLETALRGSGGKPRVVVFRMRYVPDIDATGLQAFRTSVRKMLRDEVRIILTGVQPEPMKALVQSGLAKEIGMENFCPDVDEALNRCRAFLSPTTTDDVGEQAGSR